MSVKHHQKLFLKCSKSSGSE